MHRLRNKVGSFGNLMALESAVRHGSFTMAADELRVSQPAISRRIRELEEGLGVLFFERNGKRLSVTAAGCELQMTLAHAFFDINQQIERLMRRDRPTGVTLRITPSASGWILPALGSLCNAFPDTPVNLVCLDVRADPRQAEYDLQLCFMPPARSSQHSHLLLEGEVFQVAGPAFVEKHGVDVRHAPLFQMKHPFTRALDWRCWYPQEAAALDIKTCTTYAEALEAAVTGRGMALGWKYSVSPHLEAGLLVRCSDQKRRSRFGEYLLVTPSRADDPSVQKVVNWLCNYAERLRECDEN